MVVFHKFIMKPQIMSSLRVAVTSAFRVHSHLFRGQTKPFISRDCYIWVATPLQAHVTKA